jgi:hypothetical protein
MGKLVALAGIAAAFAKSALAALSVAAAPAPQVRSIDDAVVLVACTARIQRLTSALAAITRFAVDDAVVPTAMVTEFGINIVAWVSL